MFQRLVLQGGGAKGIALVGALKALEPEVCKFKVVAGASAGSIVGSLLAAGYSADEMKVIMMDLDFGELLDGSWRRLLWLGGFGMHRGDRIREWIATLLKERGVTFFADFKKNGIEVIVVATNVTTARQMIFSTSETPNMRVADAIRMSISMPIFFSPVHHEFGFVVDGGVLSNFPLAALPSDSDPATIGIQLLPSRPAAPVVPKNKWQYALQLLNTFMDAHDATDLEQRKIETIKIDIGDTSATDFSLSKLKKEELYKRGFDAGTVLINQRAGVRDTTLRVVGKPKILNFSWPKGLSESPAAAVRCSVSGLIRITSDDCYLLIQGNRIDQLQPIGGVFKMTRQGRRFAKKIEAHHDTHIPIDDDSRFDLRLHIPQEKVEEFLQWYLAGRSREISPAREFTEELISSKLFNPDIFSEFELEWIRTHIEGIRWSEHLKCYELLVAEIFELEANDAQAAELIRMRSQHALSSQLMWVKKSDISAGSILENNRVRQISEHSAWLL